MNEVNITPNDKKEQLEEQLEDMSRNFYVYTEKDMKKAYNEWKLWRKVVKIEAKRRKRKIKTWLKIKKAVDKKYGIGYREKIKEFLLVLKKKCSVFLTKIKKIRKKNKA